jgi:hypothetical protein
VPAPCQPHATRPYLTSRTYRENAGALRRDYDYEARKRLYSEVQPLLFQLRELSESAYRWVISLARTARQGQLSWLSKGYFLSMTLYRFTAPLAVFRLIHRRLTLVDFSVDQPIRVQYNIAKQMYLSVSDGFSIAKAGKAQGLDIEYEPHEVQGLRPHVSAVHAQQHLFRGHLDMIADALVVREPEGPRCMTYGEFETQFKNPQSDVYHATRALAAGFRGFKPVSRPVVWRMLIIQVYFHKALLHTFEPDPATFDQDTATFLDSPADLLSRKSGRNSTGAVRMAAKAIFQTKWFLCGISRLLKNMSGSSFVVFSRIDVYQPVAQSLG